mmetsp:Transcript_10034/g.15863  ORF Transcript_10034/g.15863 Transcript_10034/m.15863 type:complete len:550 (-) Transcript_10034:107-1756(-)
MTSRPTSNGIQHPRHPSLDNLRRNHGNGSHRSYPQLPSDSQEGTARVRFQAEESYEENIIGLITDVITGIAALVCSFGLLTILVLVYLIVRPFSVGMARRLAAHIGAASFLDAVALLLPNTRIYLTGDSDVPSPVGTSILVSNHLMDGDWFTILMLGRCVGLRGSVKVFLRNEILNVTKHPSERTSLARRNSPPSTVRQQLAGGIAHGSLIEPSAAAHRNSPTGSSNSSSTPFQRYPTSPELSMIGTMLHTLLDFPVMNGEDYISDRENLFQLLRSFAEGNGSAAPVHLLLFPEGWSLYNCEDRKSVLSRSNEFAKREGRPQMKHLLLPRTTGFNASLESLRESNPVVYDLTMAYRGYDGSLPPKFDVSLLSLWSLLRRKYPEEIHIRIKRYSMEEVLQDASWLDKKWAEKDRLLHHFSRHNAFPADSRGFCRHRIFETRVHSVETSIVSLIRLLLLPCTVPVLLFLSIPILWTVLWAWIIYNCVKYVFLDPGTTSRSNDSATPAGETGQTPSVSAGTPFFPATPFASPSISNWRDVLANQGYENDETA